MTIKNCLVISCACFLLFSLTACPKKQVKKVDEVKDEKIEDEDVESEELDIRDKDFISIPELKTIYFDYDSSDLSNEARDILSANADYLNKHKDAEVLVEGHCDERGTIGYNLALGQKRAIAVRKYYISLGIKPKKSASISYGKEKPLCMESTEECWLKNRRSETKVAKKKEAKEDSESKERRTLMEKQAGDEEKQELKEDQEKKGVQEEKSKPEPLPGSQEKPKKTE